MSSKKSVGPDDDDSLGVLDDSPSSDTMGIGLVGHTAHVSVVLPSSEDDDLVDDEVIDGEVDGDVVSELIIDTSSVADAELIAHIQQETPSIVIELPSEASEVEPEIIAEIVPDDEPVEPDEPGDVDEPGDGDERDAEASGAEESEDSVAEDAADVSDVEDDSDADDSGADVSGDGPASEDVAAAEATDVDDVEDADAIDVDDVDDVDGSGADDVAEAVDVDVVDADADADADDELDVAAPRATGPISYEPTLLTPAEPATDEDEPLEGEDEPLEDESEPLDLEGELREDPEEEAPSDVEDEAPEDVADEPAGESTDVVEDAPADEPESDSLTDAPEDVASDSEAVASDSDSDSDSGDAAAEPESISSEDDVEPEPANAAEPDSQEADLEDPSAAPVTTEQREASPLASEKTQTAEESPIVTNEDHTPATRAAAREVALTSRRIDDVGGAAGRESADLLTADRLLEPSRMSKAEPEGTWSHLLYSISGGRINVGDGRKARERKQLTGRIAAHLPGTARFVPVLSRKGGVGKTTVTALLGMALADARDDRVIAVDANPDRGTLAERIVGTHSKSVRDLVRAQHDVSGFHDITALVARDATRLDVLASDADPRVSEAFGDADYRDVATVAAQYYSLVLTDSGTGIVHSVMGATLDLADQLIIVSGLSVDEARLASETLTWLETNGHADLARESIVVLNQSTPGAPLVRLSELESHFSTRAKHVLRIPYDAQIAGGGAIDFTRLQPETRRAAREIAATLIESLRLAGER